MPPTGKTIHVSGISIVRVADGRAAEVWQNWDMMGLMEQIHERARSATYIA
jgi:predicted ester cyclase